MTLTPNNELHPLTTEATLQETESALVTKVRSPQGRAFVLKKYHRPNRSFDIESTVLSSLDSCQYDSLILPRIVERGDSHLLMTFVEREHQTRESILERKWSRSEIRALCRAIEEFQTIALPISVFSFKQIVMGFAYPAWRAALVLRPALKHGILNSGAAVKVLWLVIRYLLLRPFFKNATTHYDLSTLNCAFTPDHQVSILDLEFSYFKGDPLFDAIYFVTIPPQSLEKWSFQDSLLAEFVSRNSSVGTKERTRLLLTLCCLIRALHFKHQDSERIEYERSLGQLLVNKRFDEWWERLVIKTTDQHPPTRVSALES